MDLERFIHSPSEFFFVFVQGALGNGNGCLETTWFMFTNGYLQNITMVLYVFFCVLVVLMTKGSFIYLDVPIAGHIVLLISFSFLVTLLLKMIIVANISMAVIFLCLAFFVDCTRWKLGVFLMCLYGIGYSASISGFFTSLLSIAPMHTGTISSLAMLFGICGRMGAPDLVGFIRKHVSFLVCCYTVLL